MAVFKKLNIKSAYIKVPGSCIWGTHEYYDTHWVIMSSKIQFVQNLNYIRYENKNINKNKFVRNI